jgi:hypothetical protein
MKINGSSNLTFPPQGSGKYYMCYSTEEHTCMNVADMSDVITVEPGSGHPNSHVAKVQVPEVDSPEACYTVYPRTAGICGLVCGKVSAGYENFVVSSLAVG